MQPFWRVPAWSNPWVWGGAALMLALQAAFVYLPWFQRVFGSAPIGALDWAWIAAAAAACMALVEVHKGLARVKRR